VRAALGVIASFTETPRGPFTMLRLLEMKIQLIDANELKSLEGLSDAELLKLVRDGFKEFRASGKADADPDAEDEPDVGGLRHGAPSKSTLETPASQRAGTLRATEDRARRADIERTQAAARQMHDARIAQDARDEEAESIIPGYRRL
jgi:hypothetical protein